MASRTVTIRIPEDLYLRVVDAARGEGVSVSEWIRRAVERALEAGPERDRLEDVERRLARLEDVAGL